MSQVKVIRFIYPIFLGILFIASFLSFSVQPLFSKLLLPNYGGSAMVWTTSALFFQVLLLLSYTYVFLLERLDWKKHFWLHALVCMVILVASATNLLGSQFSLALLPQLLESHTAGNEVWQIISVGAVSIGIAFFFLGTVSTSLQVLAAKVGIKNPYLLYRASNIGSLVGLFSFPFIIEPFTPANWLITIWSTLATVVVVLILILYIYVSQQKELIYQEKAPSKLPNFADVFRWSMLAAFPVALFLAVTNQITLGIAPIPYLWILPFGVYLISYILAFGIYKTESLLIVSLIVLSLSGLLSLTINQISMMSYLIQILVLLLVTLTASLLSHSLAYELRPNKSSLSYFYLSLAFGGMLGGLAISIVAPLLFNSYWELEILLIAAIIVALFQYRKRAPATVLVLGSKRTITLKTVSVLAVCIICCFSIMKFFVPGTHDVIFRSRNFYGTLKVSQDQTMRKLSNGTILHGSQYLDERSTVATTYYSPKSGVGKTISYFQNRNGTEPIKVGAIGLGTGSVASYCRPGDLMVFYEINEQVVQVANKYFSYLKHCENVAVKIGDARKLLANEEMVNDADKYDLLIVDAFTDDAIPTHLLTLEAAEIYLEKVKSDGAVLYHISNRYLDLEKVLLATAEQTGTIRKKLLHIPENDDNGEIKSEWVLLTKSPAVAKIAESFEQGEDEKAGVLWTDNYSNMLKVVRWY